MKTAKLFTVTAIVFAALCFTTNVKAQTNEASKWRLGIGLDAGAPTGDIHNSSNFELGGTVRLQYGLASKLALTLTSGYYNFFGKTYTYTAVSSAYGGSIAAGTIKGESVGVIPLKAGIKAFFNANLYFGAEAGAAFETQQYGETRLDLSPSLGYATGPWDISARYENFSGSGNINYGIVGARLAYSFNL